jgi:diacylglycerol O-acyltransferase 2, plant
MYGGVFEALFPGIECRVLGASGVFKFPGSREFSLWLGAVDASPKIANEVMKAGYSCIVYPGGIKEQLGDPGKKGEKERTTTFELSDRKGFVRLAITHGTPLVPVCVFNERDAYHRVHFPAGLVRFVKRTFGLPLLWFYGRFGTLLPFPIQNGLGVVFGKPLEVPHLPAVTKEDPVVEEYHRKYIAEIQKLWHEHKGKFGYAEDEKLVIA